MANSFTKRLPGGSKFVGEVFSMMARQAFSPSFPALNLATASSTILDANWPLLCPYLRNNVLLEHDPLGTPVSTCTITSWTASAGVVTLTFTSSTSTNAILQALHEDAFVHNAITGFGADYSSAITVSAYRSITLLSSLPGTNPVPAGTYQITEITGSSGTRTMKIDATGVSPLPSGPSAGGTCAFYPHRIGSNAGAVSTTSVRHLPQVGRGFMTPDGTSGLLIAGLRRRSFLQGHKHAAHDGAGVNLEVFYGGGGGVQGGGTWVNTFLSGYNTGVPKTDGSNGTPRTGLDTMGPSLALHSYIYGGVYNP